VSTILLCHEHAEIEINTDMSTKKTNEARNKGERYVPLQILRCSMQASREADGSPCGERTRSSIKTIRIAMV
jgi:hypothetical protein